MATNSDDTNRSSTIDALGGNDTIGGRGIRNRSTTAGMAKSGRILLACLIAAMIGWSVTRASAQMPANDQLKFQPLSGPYDNPVIWRVLMNDFTYSHFIRVGLVHDRFSGPPQSVPGMWRALNGQYFPMQYVGRTGAFHELRMVQQLANPVPRPTAPAMSPQQTGCCSWLWPNGITRTCGPQTFAACSNLPGNSFVVNGDCLSNNPAGTCVPRR